MCVCVDNMSILYHIISYNYIYTPHMHLPMPMLLYLALLLKSPWAQQMCA